MGLAKASGTAEKHVSGLRQSLGGVWRITGGILLFNVIRHITHSIRDLISTTMDFETQMYNVNSVAQLSTEDLKELNDQVLQLALDPRIKAGPAELAAGMYEVVSAGYSTEDAMIVMEQAAIAATAGLTTTDVAARVLTATLGSYGMGVDQAAHVTDQLFQIVNISRYTFDDLAGSMDSVLPTAAALGIGVEEIGAAMAVMASKGVDANTATVQLNGILSALLKPSDAMTEALNSMGYASGQAMLDSLGFVETMKRLSEYVNEDESVAAALFGDVRALRGEMNLTNDGGVLLSKNLDLMKQSGDGAGATAKALAEQMKASSFQIAVLRKNVQVLAIMGFGLLAPYLSKALLGINKFVVGSIESFQHFRDKGYGIFHAFRASMKTIVGEMFGTDVAKSMLVVLDALEDFYQIIKDIGSFVISVLKPVLQFMQDHWDYVGPAIMGAIIAMVALKAALIAIAVAAFIANIALSPLILAFLVIAAIGAVIAIAWTKNWFHIQENTKAAADAIMWYLTGVWDALGILIDPLVTLGKYWKKIMTHEIEPGNLENIPGWLEPIARITGRVVKSIRVFIVTWNRFGMLAAFKTIPMQIRALGRAFANLLDVVGLHKFSKIVQEDFYLVADIVKNVIDLVDNVIHGRWMKAWGNMAAILHNAAQMMINRLRGLTALIRDVWDAIPWTTIGKFLAKGFISAVKFLWKVGIPWMIGAQIALFKAFYEAGKDYFDNTIVPFVKSLPGVMVGLLAAGWILLYNIGNYLVAGLGAGISFAWNWLITWVSQLPGRIVDAFGSAWNSMFNAGYMLVDGLWKGIASIWDDMVDWVTDAIDLIPSGVRSALGMNSPSKVFKEIGVNAMLGFQQGIEGSIPSLTGSVTMTANAVTSAPGLNQDVGAGAMATNSFTTSGGNTYNFNVSSNSSDPEQVAREVSKVILAEIGRVEAGAA